MTQGIQRNSVQVPNENTLWIDQIDSQRLLSLDVTMDVNSRAKLVGGNNHKTKKSSKKGTKKVVRLKRPDGSEAFLPYWRREHVAA